MRSGEAHRGHSLGRAMVWSAVRQYIEAMIQGGQLRWPTLCRVCHRWQGQTVCAHCLLAAQLDVPRCQRCATRTTLAGGLCQSCEDGPPVFDHAVAALDYALPWNSLIASLKFKQDPAIARSLAQMLAQAVRQRWGPRQPRMPEAQTPATPRRLRAGAPTVLMPVPLSPQRLRERGYNQAGLLAHHLGRTLGVPVQHEGLIRRRHTERLMRLDAAEREAHIRHAFAVHPASLKHIQRRHVAVVDDVLTSGATLNEIARTLWQAGAREVSVWVVARTPLPDPLQTDRSPQTDPPAGIWQDTELLD